MISTYVQHNGKTYLVSTINRDSYCAHRGRYAETMVWEWDRQNIKRASDEILLQDEGAENSIYTHQRIVERIFSYGIKGEA